MARDKYRMVQYLSGAVGALFGIVTLFAGGSVLLGRDPGYVVYRPLLIFNVLMGMGYVVAGMAIWGSIIAGRKAALIIFVLNLLVLAWIVVASRYGSTVATESFGAMTFRTALWLVLFLAASWVVRRRSESQ